MTRYFTDEHEWIEVEGTTATVGITDYAQGQLGDIVFAEVPAIGATLSKGGDAAVVESVKAASDVYAPVSGTVTAYCASDERWTALVRARTRRTRGPEAIHTAPIKPSTSGASGMSSRRSP